MKAHGIQRTSALEIIKYSMVCKDQEIALKKYSFVTRMPDEPGTLHRAASIVKCYNGNINRINYDRRIDPCTVFFEISSSGKSYRRIIDDLARIGYLQTSLPKPGFLKLNVCLPNKPGALLEFLNYTTAAGSNIAFLDFDERGRHPERLTISLTLEKSHVVNTLLNQLKSLYSLEVLEYDTTGKNLDDTVFYIHFAQEIRELIGEAEDPFLLKLLHDINHIVQELTSLGNDPKKVFESILLTGRTLKQTTGNQFFAEVQRFRVSEQTELFCFQLPCGGNVFLFHTPEEMVMIDTGFGIYHQNVLNMFQYYGLGNLEKLKRIFITHADADHAGSAGYFDTVSIMHPGTLKVIKKASRAYGSCMDGLILEEVYTKLINLFSRFTSPKKVKLFSLQKRKLQSIFPVIDRIKIGELEFEVMASLGGHLFGQVFFVCHEYGLLFGADSLINFDSLTEKRKQFNILAKNLMTSVNVEGRVAEKERKALLELALKLDDNLASSGKRCMICGGHGAVSVLDGNKLETYGSVEQYRTNS